MTAPITPALTNATDLAALVLPEADANETASVFDALLAELSQTEAAAPALALSAPENAEPTATKPSQTIAFGLPSSNQDLALRARAAAAYAEAAALAQAPLAPAAPQTAPQSTALESLGLEIDGDLSANAGSSLNFAPPDSNETAPQAPANEIVAASTPHAIPQEPHDEPANSAIDTSGDVDDVDTTTANASLQPDPAVASLATIVVATAQAAPMPTAAPPAGALAAGSNPVNPQALPAKLAGKTNTPTKPSETTGQTLQPTDNQVELNAKLGESAEPKAQVAPGASALTPHPAGEQNSAPSNPVPQTAAAPLPHAATFASLDLSAAPAGGPWIATANVGAADSPVHLELTTFAGSPNAASDMGSLALRIAAKAGAGESQFTVRLDPPELGRIEVTLNVNSQGTAQANLSADKPQTLDLLQRDAPVLERALKDAGLDLAGGLSFSLRSDGHPGDWRDAPGSGGARPMQIETVDAASADAATIGAAGLIATGWGASTMRLDIRV